MNLIQRLLLIFFEPDATSPLHKIIKDLQQSVGIIQKHVTSPNLLHSVLHPGEKVHHMLRTLDNTEHVASATWDPNKQQLLDDDVESHTTYDSLSAFGSNHYNTVPNSRKSTTCRGFKECYVIRDGKRIQIYELLP
jgi:hypothetical protein